MKRVRTGITASSNFGRNTSIITPTDVVNLLSQIEELKNYNITVAEKSDGTLDFTVGDYVYRMMNAPATT